jgi:hypothetical protein
LDQLPGAINRKILSKSHNWHTIAWLDLETDTHSTYIKLPGANQYANPTMQTFYNIFGFSDML